MTRFADAAAARAAGFEVRRDPAGDRFVLSQGAREIGEAHFRLVSDSRIIFDHTVVHPEFRGTGLSQVLAHFALTSEFTSTYQIEASCWFIVDYLRDHPELATQG